MIALRIFAWLAAGSNTIFIITWIVSDMVMLLQDNGIISSFSFQETVGLDNTCHFIVFGMMCGLGILFGKNWKKDG